MFLNVLALLLVIMIELNIMPNSFNINIKMNSLDIIKDIKF